MRRKLLLAGLVVSLAAVVVWGSLRARTQTLIIDYPLEGSIFPPDLAPPTFLWRDSTDRGAAWTIEARFASGAAPLRAVSRGERMQPGEIDPRCVAETNQPPALTPEQAAAHTWKPDAALWSQILRGSVNAPATLVITGYTDERMSNAVSRSQITLRTSADPVAAPIFYRDVPLMPSETERGVIKPLGQQFTPLIAWRLRDVSQPASRVVMTGIHSCANCHSASLDGKTMGMDLDGPKNDKGLYALFPIRNVSTIRNQDVLSWRTSRGKLEGKLRVAFMSRVSPDGRYVVSTIMLPEKQQTEYERDHHPLDLLRNYYVANFKDYRFLQVFYPTRGVLAWYSAETGMLAPLPGADDPRYVHTGATWSPDGKYLVFSRAEARDAYPEGAKLATYANDPAETRIQYDLYRIPFNNGRGGTPERIEGASQNGKSNSFPKVSPDGRWIVYVQAQNGQLMRPDSKLYIVPFAGGQARLMRANTRLMNSWHSFSPNGRWLVFSSKSRSPYTQMYLTHIDENGNDSPAILIENSTAANRAVNIPEFLNIAPDGLQRIDAQAAESFRRIDVAAAAMRAGRRDEAAAELREAVALDPQSASLRTSYGFALASSGHFADAAVQFRKAVELDPANADAFGNLGGALLEMGRFADARAALTRALELKPDLADAQTSLGTLLARQGRRDEAIPHLRRAVELDPGNALAQTNLALVLSADGQVDEPVRHMEEAVRRAATPQRLEFLGELYARQGRYPAAEEARRRAAQMAGASSMNRR
jgi:tetratricopeptide (TPR) repeat protein